MQANSFLIINGAIVFFLVLRLFTGRKADKPTPLQVGDPKPNLDRPSSIRFDTGGTQERVLNFLFNHNGVQYDLFAVLGLPAGAPREACVKALNLLKTRPKRDVAFLETIEKAIEQAFPIP